MGSLIIHITLKNIRNFNKMHPPPQISGKCIWKCCLQYASHFVWASMRVSQLTDPPDPLWLAVTVCPVGWSPCLLSKSTCRALSRRGHASWSGLAVTQNKQTCKVYKDMLYLSDACKSWWLNTLGPRQNGRHFPDNIFKCIFLNENVWILIKISLKFVRKG